jgi:4-amino-4-deoxy-L-arabinose transferase-like glycosyltransferase
MPDSQPRASAIERGGVPREPTAAGSGSGQPCGFKAARTGRGKDLYPFYLFGIATVVRIAYILTSQGNPFFSVPIVDLRYNWDFAGEILAKGISGVSPDFLGWKPVIYPAFLALVRFLSGSSLTVSQILQSILGAFNCVLLYHLAKRHFEERVSHIAGGLMALYGPFIFYDATFLPVTLSTFFVLCLLLSISKVVHGSKDLLWLLPGGLLALAANTHQIILSYALAVPAMLCVWRWDSTNGASVLAGRVYRALGRPFLYVAAGFLVVAGPFALRSSAGTGRASLGAGNGGINFYLGNRRNADGISAPPMGLAWLRLVNEPNRAHPTATMDDNGTSYFYRKALREIGESPGRALGLFLKKLGYLCSGVEIKNNVDMYRYADASPVLRPLLWATPLLSFPFGVVWPLAILGIVACWRTSWRGHFHLHLFLLTLFLGIGLFFVCARYRMILIPVVLLFAAQALDLGISHLRKRGWSRTSLLGAGLLAAGLVLANLPNRYLMQVNAKQEFLDYQQLAKSQFVAHQLDGAEASIQRAIALNPAYVDSYYILGGIKREKGDLDAALRFLGEALRRDPQFQEAREIVAEIQIQRGHYQQAVDELMNILFHEEDWYDDKSPTNAAQLLGNLYYAVLHDEPKAACFFERYLQLLPDETRAENANLPNVKRLLAATRDRDYSVMMSYLQEMQARDAHNRAAHLRVAEIYLKQGASDLAERELAEIHVSDPSTPDARAALFLSLGRLYAMTDQNPQRAQSFYARYRAALARSSEIER